MDTSSHDNTRKPFRYRKVRFRRSRKTSPGAPPGAGVSNVELDSIKPVVRICSYDADNMDVVNGSSAQDVQLARSKFPDRFHWIEVQGFGDRGFLEQLSLDFNIHRLEMDDVVNTYQRPKVEETEEHLFIISRPVNVSPDTEGSEGDTTDDQVSMFLGKNYVLTFQEKQINYTTAVFERLSQNKGYIRKNGPDYLAYAIIDTIVDSYFPLLEKLGNYLDDLEDKLLEAPEVYSLQNIQGSKRKLIFFRRIMWSEREKLNELLRAPGAFIKDSTKRYLRDTYDHTIQIMDMIDSYREITASLMDIYLSSVSNKMNSIMKVLTIISTIFIPLTFIVGLYGMNFAFSDPETGKALPLNMPELHAPYGYIIICVIMVLITILQIYLFYRKGWIDFKGKN